MQNNIHLLLINNNQEVGAYILFVFDLLDQWQIQCDTVTTGELATDYLAGQTPDVALLGNDLTSEDTLTFLQTIAQQQEKLPLIIIASPEQQALAIELVEGNPMFDYLVQGKYEVTALSQALRAGLRCKQLQANDPQALEAKMSALQAKTRGLQQREPGDIKAV